MRNRICGKTVYCDRVYADDRFTVYFTNIVWVYGSGTISLNNSVRVYCKISNGYRYRISRSLGTTILFV